MNASSDVSAAPLNTVASYAGDPVPPVNQLPVRNRSVPSEFERDNFHVMIAYWRDRILLSSRNLTVISP